MSGAPITCYLCEAPFFGSEYFLVDDYGKKLLVCEGCYEDARDEEFAAVSEPESGEQR